MKLLERGIYRIYEATGLFLIICMTILIIICIFLRYIFGITFIWAEELITFIFIGTTFFGAVLCIRDDEHISISFLVDSLPPKFKKAFYVANTLITIAVLVILFVVSIGWIGIGGDKITNGLRIQIIWFYLFIPISFGGMILLSIFKLIHLIFNTANTGIEKEA